MKQLKEKILRLVKQDPASLLKKEAMRFNKKHTLKTQYQTGQWMCSTCGKVHKSIGWTFWTGSQYPACCDYLEGHRVFEVES